jgi:DNA-binding response OmpR family regulator
MITKDGGVTSTSTTVLVAEPDILVRMVIAEYLRTCGYKVIEAGSAGDVLSVLASEFPVHVVFAEITGLGTIDGFGLARQIRGRYPEVDVILTSGVTQAADKAADLCDEGVLKKPYRPEEVTRRINVLRERRRSARP